MQFYNCVESIYIDFHIKGGTLYKQEKQRRRERSRPS